MRILAINWVSEEVLEAKIILTDGIYDLICFAYPFNLKIGDEIDIPLFAFEATHIQRIVNQEYIVEKQFSSSYYFQGLLISIEKGLVKVGGFTIQIDDYIPADIKDLEFISFICDRLDLLYTTKNSLFNNLSFCTINLANRLKIGVINWSIFCFTLKRSIIISFPYLKKLLALYP